MNNSHGLHAILNKVLGQLDQIDLELGCISRERGKLCRLSIGNFVAGLADDVGKVEGVMVLLGRSLRSA